MSPSLNVIRIATRKSPLALVQAYSIGAALQTRYPELAVEYVPLTTSGDRHLASPLMEVGGKGLFVKELEYALLNHQADIAVHSMKDMPMTYPEGLTIPVVCERADPRDVLVARDVCDLFSLPAGAKIGTSSLRRQCQLLSLRPDIEIVPLRGNVNSRLQKLDEGLFDALVLAMAGLERLDFTDRITCPLSPELCLPAPGQGALGLECRVDDEAVQQLIAPFNDPTTFHELTAERAFSARLNGGCRAPVAAYAQVSGGRLWLQGMLGQPDGSVVLRGQKMGSVKEAQQMGELLAEELISNASST